MDINKTWIVSDLSGRDIFYFELFTIDNGRLSIDSNLNFRGEPVIDIIEKLIYMKLNNNEIEELAQELFEIIKTTPYFSQFYFSETVLNKDGKINMEYYKTLNKLTWKQIISNQHFLVPISETQLPELFRVFNEYFISNSSEIMNQSEALSKGEFENELTNDLLREEYVNVYDPSNLLYKYIDDEKKETTYFVLKNSQFVFGFKKSNEIS